MTANDRVDELSHNQVRALGALLTSTSLASAAEEAKVGEKTLRRWLHENEGFRQAYREQGRAALDGVRGLLEAGMYEAVEVLRDAMREGSMNARIRAAGMILEHGLKSLQFEQIDLKEFEEIRDRLEALEEAAAEAEPLSNGRRW